jgi:hypothetical protein
MGGSNGTGAASRGVEWWPEVVRCGGGAAELRRSRRKVMTGGAHLSACHIPFRERGNEASIRVPRMFKSHV